MLSRRQMMGKLAVGAAGAAVALTAGVELAGATLSPADARGTSGAGKGGEDQLAPAFQAAAAPEVPLATDLTPKAPVNVIDAALPTTAPPPWELMRPLVQGANVAYGWRVAELSGVVDGSCVLTLENKKGRTHRVHICRNDGRPQGLVYTDRLDLVVMNGGRGDLPTEEGLAQAVAKVAHVVAANERHRRHERVVAELMPQSERERLFAGPVDRRLR